MSRYFLLVVLFILLFSGCISPYQGQANALTAAYQRGEISANDYQARINELQALDLQRRQAVAQAWQQGCNNMAAQYQTQQAQRNLMLQNYQMNRPSYSQGTIYTPSGQMYLYNSTNY